MKPVHFLPLRARALLSLALVLAALFTAGMLFVNESTHGKTVRAIARAQQGTQMHSAVNMLMRRLAEAESAQRGYILTGEAKYLTPYADALAALRELMRELERAMPHDIATASQVHDFTHALAQKIGEMDLTVRLRKDNRPEVVDFIVNSDVGLEQMDDFRAKGQALLDASSALTQAQLAHLHRQLTLSRLGVAAGALAALLAFFLYVGQSRALRRAARQQQRLLQAERDALETQVRERTARLTELATHLQNAVEDERAHLARELHDELGALLTAAKLDVARLKSRLPPGSTDLVERLQHLTSTLNQGIALKRRIIEDLRPSSLSNLGLVPALDILAREFASRSEVAVETALEPVGLDAARELTIYRLVQEALTNIGKYAKARHVKVELKNYMHHAEVSVTDDGVGFDKTAIRAASHGLMGMHHRMEAGGGRLEVDSAPGRGTRITGTLPHSQPQSPQALVEAVQAMSASSYGATPSA
ncbi:histidine kinase [Comamonadaceae bacterium OH2545_COT-014]|nr:histidine kinase [Comamonadaceae bacterium OH2545_COT-014]